MGSLTSQLVVRLIDQVTGPARGVGRALTGLNRQIAGAGGNIENRLGNALDQNNAALDRTRGQLIDGIAALYAFKAAMTGVLTPTIELEEKLADLRKVASVDDAGMRDLEAAIRRVSDATGKAQSEVAATMAAAAQGGIGNDDLEAYSKMVLQVGVAWDMTGDQAGEALAKTQTAMQWTVEQTRQFADEINTLSDSTAASTNELLEFSRRSLAAGKTAGMSAKETLAFGAAMISAGAAPEVAATSFLNLTRAMTKGDAATKRQRAAFKALGFDMKALQKNMQADGIGTVMQVFEAIQKLPREQRTSVISELFGDEARALAPLLENLDLIRENYAAVADEAKTAGSVQREFEQRSKTTANALRRLRTAMENIAISIGSAITPALADMADNFAPIAGHIADLVARFPRLTQAVVGTVAALAALRIGLIGLQFIGLNLKGALLTAALGITRIGGAATAAARNAVALQVALGAMSGQKLTGFQTMTTALRGMALAVPGVTAIGGALTAVGTALAAISAPAWGMIAVGVAAVAAAGALMWKYWDRISSVVGGVAKRIGEELAPALELAKPMLRPYVEIGKLIGEGFSYAAEKIGEFAGWIGSFFSREVLSDEQKAGFERAGYDVADRMINAIKAKIGELIDWFRSLPGKIVDAIGSIDIGSLIKWPSLPSWAGGGSAQPATPANDNPPAISGQRASGGPVWGGQSYLVGERGPEIFTPGRTGTITPNAGGASSRPTQIGPFHITGVTDPEEVARVVSRTIRDEWDREMRGAHSDMGAR